jgi:hypothetical protein
VAETWWPRGSEIGAAPYFSESEGIMISENLNGLMNRVQEGDCEAAERLQRVMRPVVSRQVRQVLQTADYATPLGRRVQSLLLACGCGPTPPFDRLEPTVVWIAQAICGEKVAQLKARGRLAVSAAETVRC